MRRALSFACAGETLAATLDEAPAHTALLIVTGGVQVRVGAHRGQARLAHEIAAAGFPVLRFDRRGIGDSGGDDPGFRASGPDIAAAAAVLRTAQPQVMRIVGYGLCDAASALALHGRAAGLDALVLANPWVVEPAGDLPPPAAIRRRYAERLLSPAAWRRLLGGGINLRKAARGLRAAAASSGGGGLATDVAAGLATLPVHLLLAEDDATAIAFAAELKRAPFAAARAHPCHRLASGSHSFAGDADAEWLAARVLAVLCEVDTKPT